MTTQTCTITVGSKREALKYTITATDDVFTELKDEVDTLSLWETMQKEILEYYTGEYAAGGAIARIRNTVTNEIKIVLPLALTTENRMRDMMNKVRVEEHDIIEVKSVAVPT